MKKKSLLFLAIFISFISLAQQDIDVIIRNSSITSGSNFELGSVMIDYPSTNVIIVSNSGDATLTLNTNAIITGTDNADFLAEGGLTGTIAVGENKSFSLTFDPTTSGAKTATISISSDDPDEATFSFTLSGTAVNKPSSCQLPTMDMESFYNGSMLQLNFGNGQAEGTSDFESPSGWTPLLGQVFAIFGNEIYVAETADARSGSSALELSSFTDGNGDLFSVIPCADYPTKFSGYYKLSNAGFGTATIVVSTGGGQEENRTSANTDTLEITATASSYTLFEMDLNYDANSVDSLFLYVAASTGIATVFTIDDLFITSGTVSIGVPFAPNSVTFSNQSTSSVTVNWTEPNDYGSAITGYTLEQKIGAGSYAMVYTGTDLSYVASGLTEGETYFYRVKATNGEGDSEFSDEVSFVPSSNIIMSNSSTSSCNASFFDSGGSAGAYADGENFTLTIEPENPGDLVSISFTSFELENNFDFLTVYNGPNTSSPILMNLTGSSLPDDITASGLGGELTFLFTSDGSGTAPGWEATISCVTPPFAVVMSNDIISTCDALFFDSGGSSSQYEDDENFTLTIDPETLGGKVMVSFTSFALENNFDFLEVYDGPNTSSSLLFNLTGSSLPSDITATESGGELTFHFTSDGSGLASGWEAVLSCVINSTTWDGSSWDNGTPDEDTYAIIAGNYTGAGFTCSNLDVNTGQAVSITSGVLDIKGDAYNDGTVNVESGSTLVTYDGFSWTGNNITIRRNTRYAVEGKYSFVGTPVEQDASIVGSDLGTYVYKYNEFTAYGADGINRWAGASADELIPGKGYTQAFQQEIIFNGVPNTGTITYTGTYTEDTDDADEGWNLVANPYPAAINVVDFFVENDHTSGAVYIWDDNGSDTQRGTNADYITANGTMVTNTIPTPAGGASRYNFHLGSAQGFFVKLNNVANTDILFNEGMRRGDQNGDANFFRATELPIARLNLTNAQGLFKQTVIGFAEDATDNELNRRYDAQAFSATSDDGLFTMKAGRSLTLNGVTETWESIQLQLNAKGVGLYTISVELEAYDQLIYLKDNLTGEITDLRTESYSFSTQAGIHTDRFELLSSPSNVLGLEEETVLVYAKESILYIRPSDKESREYQLFNMQGRKLMSIDTKGNKEVNLQSYNSGIYLVFDGQKTHKIILE